MQFVHHQIDVNEGPLHVVEAGDPTKATLLFLHGWPESWQTWAPVMELASEKAHVELASEKAHAVAIDLPGVASL